MGFIKWLVGGYPNYKYIEKQRNLAFKKQQERREYLCIMDQKYLKIWNLYFTDPKTGSDNFVDNLNFAKKKWRLPDWCKGSKNVPGWFFSNHPDLLPDDYYELVYGPDDPKSISIRERKIKQQELIIKQQELAIKAQELKERYAKLQDKSSIPYAESEIGEIDSSLVIPNPDDVRQVDK